MLKFIKINIIYSKTWKLKDIYVLIRITVCGCVISCRYVTHRKYLYNSTYFVHIEAPVDGFHVYLHLFSFPDNQDRGGLQSLQSLQIVPDSGLGLLFGSIPYRTIWKIWKNSKYSYRYINSDRIKIYVWRNDRRFQKNLVLKK